MPDNLLSPEYGLSNSKLEECTANPSDVMNGKTFYSGDKTKKTGTFRFNGSAEPGDVAEGKTFYNYNQSLITGTLPDRNTVGKNSCVGMNINYPEIAFSYGSAPQITSLLNGAKAFAIMVPWGWYRGDTYVGMNVSDITGVLSPTIKYAGRIWANGYANGSGHNETDFGANNQYCTGEKGTYDARIRAKVSGQFAVYIQRNNSGPEFKSKWFNAGEELAWVGPSSYGNAQAYYVSL